MHKTTIKIAELINTFYYFTSSTFTPNNKFDSFLFLNVSAWGWKFWKLKKKVFTWNILRSGSTHMCFHLFKAYFVVSVKKLPFSKFSDSDSLWVTVQCLPACAQDLNSMFYMVYSEIPRKQPLSEPTLLSALERCLR